MSDIVERLRDPKVYIPGEELLHEAADTITRLRNELHIAKEWSAQVIAGQEQDIAEITHLRAINAELVNVVNAADDLRIAIRKAGVKRQHPELYMAICAFDSCRAAIAKAESETP